MYSLKYYALGVELSGQNYKIYLRYYLKRKSLNIPTDYVLTKYQVQMVNENKLGGTLQHDLDKLKSDVMQVISGLTIINNYYPTPDQLREFYIEVEHQLPMELYVSNFLKQLDVKRSSKIQYSSHLRQFKDYYERNLTKVDIKTLIDKKTVEDFGNWVKAKKEFNHKTITKVQLYNLKGSVFRLLNYIAEKKKQPPITPYLKTPKSNNKYTPTDEVMDALLSYDFFDNPKLERIQDFLYINSLIGLRINELLHIRKENIQFKKDHCIIRFVEFKKDVLRDVVIIDEKAIELLKKYSENDEERLIKITSVQFNVLLKKLALEVLNEKKTYIYNIYKGKEIEHNIADIISSHCIRRYAIIKNIEKHGIDFARSMSGHQSYQIVTNHYAKESLNTKVLLKKLRKKN